MLFVEVFRYSAANLCQGASHYFAKVSLQNNQLHYTHQSRESKKAPYLIFRV